QLSHNWSRGWDSLGGSARDLRFFREIGPPRAPLGHLPSQGLDQAADLLRERPADVVVVAGLQPELPVHPVPRPGGATEDVHRAQVPFLERALRLVPAGALS